MYNDGQVLEEWTEIDAETGKTVYCEKVYQFGKMWTFRETFGNTPLVDILRRLAGVLDA